MTAVNEIIIGSRIVVNGREHHIEQVIEYGINWAVLVNDRGDMFMVENFEFRFVIKQVKKSLWDYELEEKVK